MMILHLYFFFLIFLLYFYYIFTKTIPDACANALKSYLFGFCDVDGIVAGCVIFVDGCGSYDNPYLFHII